jgi:hypothetical protein
VSQQPFHTPGAGPTRTAVERRASTFVVWLAVMPRAIPFVAVAIVMLLGLFLPGVAGAVLLLVVVTLMGLLSYLAWPAAAPQTRALRLLVLAVVVAFAVVKLT